MKKLLFGVILNTIAFSLWAQDDIDFTPPKTINIDDESDLTNQWETTLGWGFIIAQPNAPGAEIKPVSSHQFHFGLKYFFDISKIYLPGFELNYEYNTYKLVQDSNKIFPNTNLHQRQQLNINTINLQFNNRLVFKRKEQKPYLFMDISGYAGWNFATSVYTVDTHTSVNYYGGSKTEVYYRNLIYIEDLQYGIKTALFIKNFGIYGQYRLNNLIKKSFYYPDMPQWLVGIMIKS
ncbi:MAG: hypothetical protein KatS3mg034_1918 [Vicingaceae bacterium]|nr:MAG: hypothetical protein KatS3mg034_1918 [Vicingaceae bacterium]